MNQFAIRQNSLCHEVRDILEVYLANELDAERHATIEAHIAVCPKCQNEVSFAVAISEALQALPRPEPPPKIFDEVSAYVRAHPDNSKKWTRWIFQLLALSDNLTALPVRVGALACFIGIVLFGIYQYQHHTRIMQASRDLDYALSKLQYAVERRDIVVNKKLSNAGTDEASRGSFVMIEEASRRVLKQRSDISSAIHRSLNSLNRSPEVTEDTKYHEDSHQKGETP